jgi:hypothetical protein
VAACGRVYDAYYAREWTDISDGSLVRMAIEEGRVLLTSDRGFLKRKPVRDEEDTATHGEAPSPGGPAPPRGRELRPGPASLPLYGV